MNHDPFSALNTEQTVIRPRLGRPSHKPGDLSSSPPQEVPSTGLSHIQKIASARHGAINGSLLDKAMPLLLAGSKMHQYSLAEHELASLHEILSVHLDKLDYELSQAGGDSETRLATRYLLCTFLDELIANTPWGSQGHWSRYSLLLKCFKETWGGEKVFSVLDRLQQKPVENQQLLTLFYLTFSLGFRGKYHVLPSGAALFDQLRSSLGHQLRRLNPPEPALCDHWQTQVEPRQRTLKQVPYWLMPVVSMTLALFVFLFLFFDLNAKSDQAFEYIAALDTPIAQWERPVLTPPEIDLGQFLKDRLAPHIQQKRLQVERTQDRWTIRLVGDGLFSSGSIDIGEPYLPVLIDLAEALSRTTGPLNVAGHTDNQPIRSVAFPSNWHLSAARADQVLQRLAPSVGAERLVAEGAGASFPLASNQEPAGRALNRRVEITLSQHSRIAQR
ncbi:MAG: type IVB secretion system protein IcmH/DotU [Limnobacter sp.]|nr:type IVB secretion system protein IcmH/DotU [Limnobacter sp.]